MLALMPESPRRRVAIGWLTIDSQGTENGDILRLLQSKFPFDDAFIVWQIDRKCGALWRGGNPVPRDYG
jgi:hypothetical protein